MSEKQIPSYEEAMGLPRENIPFYETNLDLCDVATEYIEKYGLNEFSNIDVSKDKGQSIQLIGEKSKTKEYTGDMDFHENGNRITFVLLTIDPLSEREEKLRFTFGSEFAIYFEKRMDEIAREQKDILNNIDYLQNNLVPSYDRAFSGEDTGLSYDVQKGMNIYDDFKEGDLGRLLFILKEQLILGQIYDKLTQMKAVQQQVGSL